MTSAPADLVPATRNALALLLLSMADDELVLGFSDSEWTGIAPILEEDVAMSSLAQDELGHAQALYRLLAEISDDGRDADAIAYDRPAEGYYHARLLDHPRGDWATTIARRYLYDTADAIRLEALPIPRTSRCATSWARSAARSATTSSTSGRGWNAWPTATPSRAGAWSTRWSGSARTDGRCSRRCPATCRCGWPGSWTRRRRELDARWRSAIGPTLEGLGLPMPGRAGDPARARTGHSDAFRWLHGELTSVRRLDPAATW